MAAHQKSAGYEAEAHAGHHGIGRYVVIWLVLLVFTALTVITGKIDLGAANLPLALTIATVKATLVVLFFMHLSEAHGMNRLVFGVSVVFVIVLILGVFGDFWTRLPTALPHDATVNGVPAFRDEPTKPAHETSAH